MSEETKKVQDEAAEAAEEKTILEDEAKAGPEEQRVPDAEETGTSEAAGNDAKEEAKEDGTSAEEDSPKEDASKESDRYMRLMAEFQNYKKRVAREKSDIRTYANEEIVTELLSVLDNFERALGSDASADAEAYAKGMELIFSQLKAVLEKAGLEEVTASGEEFDPLRHNAVMTEDTDEVESGKVSKVLQKGYQLNKKVIRPAMVAVAN